MIPSDSARAITTGRLQSLVDGTLRGPADVAIIGVNAIHEAGPGEITFVTSASFARAWAGSSAAAVIVSRGVESHLPQHDSRPVIVVTDAETAIVPVLSWFMPDRSTPESGVDPTAVVHPTVRVGNGARVGPMVWVDQGCVLGEAVVLHPGVRVYRDVSIGRHSVLHANVVVRERTVIGEHVVVHQNASIGADGFGYSPAPNGSGLLKIPHIGNVIIENDVEIGAGACIDRAKFGSTRIGAGTKIDNLCQIGHNCRIGRCCVIAAQAGLAGSCVVGDGVQIGGQVGIADHITIGSGARLGAQSGVIGDVPPGETWLGYPAGPAQGVLRQWSAARKLPNLIRRLPDEADSRPAPPVRPRPEP